MLLRRLEQLLATEQELFEAAVKPLDLTATGEIDQVMRRNFQYGRLPTQLPGGSYSHTQTSRSLPRATAHPTSFVPLQTICV